VGVFGWGFPPCCAHENGVVTANVINKNSALNPHIFVTLSRTPFIGISKLPAEVSTSKRCQLSRSMRLPSNLLVRFYFHLILRKRQVHHAVIASKIMNHRSDAPANNPRGIWPRSAAGAARATQQEILSYWEFSRNFRFDFPGDQSCAPSTAHVQRITRVLFGHSVPPGPKTKCLNILV
jgi:hypothetical protein